jgi:hypothetical protein
MTSGSLRSVVARRGAFSSKAMERCRGAGAMTGSCGTSVFLGAFPEDGQMPRL